MWLLEHFNTRLGIAWPSLERLAKETDFDRSTVANSIRHLEKLRYLQHRTGKGNRNEYSFILEPSTALDDCAEGEPSTALDGCSPVHQTAPVYSARQETTYTPVSSAEGGVSGSPSGEAAGAAPLGETEAAEWWEVLKIKYPKVGDDALAFREATKLVKDGVEPELLVRRMREHGQLWASRKTPERWIPFLANWLKNRVWEKDDPRSKDRPVSAGDPAGTRARQNTKGSTASGEQGGSWQSKFRKDGPRFKVGNRVWVEDHGVGAIVGPFRVDKSDDDEIHTIVRLSDGRQVECSLYELEHARAADILQPADIFD